MELGVSKLRGYREFVSARDIITVYNVYCSPKNFILKAFPPALALASHQPFFLLKCLSPGYRPQDMSFTRLGSKTLQILLSVV